MNRARLQQLANDRLRDAEALLAANRWSAAYYLAGYAVECGLKSCVLRYVDESGAIFEDGDYLKSLAGCWTHNFDKLLKLADLVSEHGRALQANADLQVFWAIAQNWNEASRYKEATEDAARKLIEAISHDPNGVLRWIQTHW